MLCVHVGVSGVGEGAAIFADGSGAGWLFLPLEPVSGECPAGSIVFLDGVEFANLYSMGSSITAMQSALSDLQTEVSQISQSGPGAGPVYNPGEAGAIFFLMVGIPIILFGVSRGLGAILNMVRRA